MLQETSDLKLINITEATDVASPTSRFLLRGSVKSDVVIGKDFFAQYKTPEGYLACLSEDCPFEEALHIYLLDHQGQVLDQLELSAPYRTGVYTLKWIKQDGLLFSFFDEDEQWRLTILSSPGWRLSLPFSLVKSRKWINRGYLKLSRDSQA